eukprot:4569704-Heterocapsa_arctica.AAC.1
MEHHAASIEDSLIGPLSYKLKEGASYVTNRRSVSYFPQGGNTYSPNGVKVINFNITGNEWLDPSTLRVMFQLNNNNPNQDKFVQPVSWNPAVFFRRARLLGGGQKASSSISSEGFGAFDDKYGTGPIPTVVDGVVTVVRGPVPDLHKTYNSTDHDASGIVRGARKVVFKPCLGLLNQDKLIPIRDLPLELELEVVSFGTDATQNAGYYGAEWSISDVQLKSDLLTLDSSLDNK